MQPSGANGSCSGCEIGARRSLCGAHRHRHGLAISWAGKHVAQLASSQIQYRCSAPSHSPCHPFPHHTQPAAAHGHTCELQGRPLLIASIASVPSASDEYESDSFETDELSSEPTQAALPASTQPPANSLAPASPPCPPLPPPLHPTPSTPPSTNASPSQGSPVTPPGPAGPQGPRPVAAAGTVALTSSLAHPAPAPPRPAADKAGEEQAAALVRSGPVGASSTASTSGTAGARPGKSHTPLSPSAGPPDIKTSQVLEAAPQQEQGWLSTRAAPANSAAQPGQLGQPPTQPGQLEAWQGGESQVQGQVQGQQLSVSNLHPSPLPASSTATLQVMAPPLAPLAGGSALRVGLAAQEGVTVTAAAAAAGLQASGTNTRVQGWVLALSLLLAVRLSRQQAEADRLDSRALKVRQGERRLQSQELRAKRAAFLEAERRRKEAEAADKLEEARRQSEREAAEREAREAAYREAAKQETARLWAAQEAARKEFQAKEAVMGEELQRRTQAEVRLREQQEAARREEAARRLRAEQDAQARQAAAAAARAAEQEAARQAAAAARADELRRIRAAQTRYCISLLGEVEVQTTAPNTLLKRSGGAASVPAVPVLARLRLQLSSRVTAAVQLAPPSSLTPPSHGPGPASNTGAGSPPATQPSSSSSGGVSGSVGSSGGGGGVPGVERLVQGRQAQGVGRTQRVEALVESAEGAMEEVGQLAGGMDTLPLLWRALGQEGQTLAAQSAPREDPTAPPSPSSLLMDELELQHWLRLSTCQWVSAARQASAQLVALAGPSPLAQPFKVELRRACLPPTHYASLAGRLTDAAFSLTQGQLQEVVDTINMLTEEEADMLDTPLPPPGSSTSLALQGGQQQGAGQAGRQGGEEGELEEQMGAVDLTGSEVLPPLTLLALVYAHLLDRMAGAAGLGPEAVMLATDTTSTTDAGSGPDLELASGGKPSLPAPALVKSGSSSSSSSSSAGGAGGQGGSGWPGLREQALALVRFQLQQQAQGQPLDSLAPTARCLAAALGGSHPVVGIMAELAERNQSAGTRLKLELRKQRAELDAANALMQAQKAALPRAGSSSPGERASSTPVPEQLWAVRNVANKMVRFGDPNQMSEALGMLEGAVKLAGEHYGADQPGCLAPCMDLMAALQAAVRQVDEGSEREAQLAGQAAQIAEQVSTIVGVLSRKYQQQRDGLSLVILNEASVKELGQVLPRSHPGLVSLQRAASDAFYTLSPPDARLAMSKRGAAGSLLVSLGREFTPELGVYSVSKRGSSRAEQWARGLPLAPLR